VRGRELSALELVEAQLARIERLDPRLGCYVTVLGERARRRARELDRGGSAGPLHGIPVSVKDNLDVSGVPTTAGSPVLGARPAGRDAEAVRRLEAAGAVVVGKTILYELAFGAQNERFGQTPNPWRLDRSTGGSSSGSVAAVAAGLCFASLASDTGGSIRVPAAFCGVVGLKPTAGLVPCEGLVPLSRLDHVGPVARTVGDVALVLEALGVAVGGLEAGAAGLRIGVVPAAGPIEPEVAGAVAAAAAVLAAEGAELQEVERPDLDAAREALWTIASSDAARHWLAAAHEHADELHPLVRARIEAGASIPPEQVAEALRTQRRLSADLAAQLATVDVLLLPVAPLAAYRLGARTVEVAGVADDVSAHVTRWTPLFSLTGSPAVAVPCGFTADGLPIGLQLAAAAGRELVLLRVARAYERATPWHRAHPLV